MLVRSGYLLADPSINQDFPGSPLLAWDDDTADATPDFTVSFDERALVGDVVRVQYSSDINFSSPSDVTNTLDSGEVTAGEAAVALPSLSDGVYFVRARIERGAIVTSWSVIEVIELGDGVYYLLVTEGYGESGFTAAAVRSGYI